jgi:tRNA threonylcarbamoyladenosine biosynthesis protein TsaE
VNPVSPPTPLLRSESPEATQRLGAAIGGALLAGDLLDIDGPLGAGKTCLVRGIVAGAGGDPAAVRSPTFVLHLPHAARRLVAHHVDLYRLGPGADIDFLDLDALLEDGAALVEWGEYADLARFAPARIDIRAGEGEDRMLQLRDDAPAHLLAVWRRLAAAETKS